MQEAMFDPSQSARVQRWLWDRDDPAIKDVLNSLAHNPRRLIELRYGLADGHRYTVAEAAKVFAKTPSWVAEIESYALFQLYEILVLTGRLPVPVAN